MQIDDAIDAFVGVLELDPVHHGAEIVAEMQVPGRLHAGKNAKNGGSHRNPWLEAGAICPQSPLK
jgi:hypothetical protein